MAIELTKAAAAQVTKLIKMRKNGIGVRLGIKTSGCSGLAYQLEFADALSEHDQVFISYDVKLIVDKKNLIYLNGTELDFVKDGLNEGFKFKNPNAKGECGCGESFSV